MRLIVKLFLLLGLSAVARPTLAQNKLLLSDVRVAPDAQNFAFSASIGAEFRLYEQAFAPSSRAQAISPYSPNSHCFSPAYSADGRYLLYLQEPVATSAHYADLVLYDRQTRRLTAGTQLITQALFSFDSQRIIYIQANFFGRYSPVGPKAAHELDIYSTDLAGQHTQQHSMLAAYTLGNLTPLRAPDTYLVNLLEPRKKLSGTYAYSLASPDQLQFVPDSTTTAHGLDYLPNLGAVQRLRVAYSIGKDLFVKNMRTGRLEPVYSATAPHPMAFVGSQPALLFSERGTTTTSFGIFNIKRLDLETLTETPVVIQLE